MLPGSQIFGHREERRSPLRVADLRLLEKPDRRRMPRAKRPRATQEPGWTLLLREKHDPSHEAPSHRKIHFVVAAIERLAGDHSRLGD